MLLGRTSMACRPSFAVMPRAWLWVLRIDRVCWLLALVSIAALLGQEICRSSALALAVSISDFEGFEEDLEDDDGDSETLPTPPVISSRPVSDRDRRPSVPSPSPQADNDVIRQTASPASVDNEPNSRHEYWDEDEFEGVPEYHGKSITRPTQFADLEDSKVVDSKGFTSRGPQSYYIEIICIIFLLAFAVAYFLGRKENESIALAWAAQFAGKDSIFEKSFSLLGTGTEADAPLLIKEAQNLFKFYASGRRYCMGLLATMDLRSRHDLITCMWYLVSPKRDEITVDVFMNDENMDPMTLALVHRKNLKSMIKEWKDLQLYAPAQVQRKGLTEELVIVSESKDLAADMLTDAVIDQVFGEKAFEKYGRHFLSLHFTDQFPLGSHKKVLRFKFAIPPIANMVDMSRLIALIPYYIDLVGRYKLNAQLRAKAEAARAKVVQQAFKEAQILRQDTLQRKKEERRRMLESSESKISTEASRKREEKERLRQLKKAMPRIKITRA